MNICIIPARIGSKRIPFKNIKFFSGKPIIAYSIEAAKKSKLFDHIIVSTDDERISKIAKQYEAEVPFIRPKNISDDYTATIDVVAHATKWCLKQGWSVKLICCIYATAPLIDIKDLKVTFKAIKTGKWDYSFPICEFSEPIFRSFKKKSDGSIEMFFPENFDKRSQDFPIAFHDTGQFYWGKVDSWLRKKNIFDKFSFTISIPRWRVQDIDTLQDWKRAEALYEAIPNKNS